MIDLRTVQQESRKSRTLESDLSGKLMKVVSALSGNDLNLIVSYD